MLKETSYQEEEFGDLDEANLSKRHSLDAIEAWRARKYSISSFKTTGVVDDVSFVEPDVEPEPLIDNKKASIDLPRTTTSVDEAFQSGPAETRIEAAVLKQEQEDVASLASYVREERATDSSTIIGDDLTFADDDTAVEVATVLGRGRQQKAFEKILEEESGSTKDESALRVSFDLGSDNHAAGAGLSSVKGLDSSTRLEHALDSTKTKSPAPAQIADTTIVGYDETLMDDETVGIADVTVLGRGRQRKSVHSPANTATSLTSKPEANGKLIVEPTIGTTSPGEHTVKEIIVDTSASSCSMDHDNSTTDVSVLDSTLASPRSIVKEAEDETTVGSLLVTPVLDRYRLEADDTSVGVKVVPNERGVHHDVPKQKQKNLLTKYGAAQRPIASPFVTQRTRTVYRKTPHPKKAGAMQTDDENKAPNIGARTPQSQHSSTKPKGEYLRSPFSRISLPELTHRPYRKSLPSTARRLPFSTSKSEPERRHTISFKQQSSMSRTPLTAAWIAKHMPEESRSSLVDSLDVSGDSSFSFI